MRYSFRDASGRHSNNWLVQVVGVGGLVSQDPQKGSQLEYTKRRGVVEHRRPFWLPP